jgi:mono/diheme cytochrome c family protein
MLAMAAVAAEPQVRVGDRAAGVDALTAVVVSDGPELLSESERLKLHTAGWRIAQLNVAEGIRLRYLRSPAEAPLVVIADAAGIVRRIVRAANGAGILRATESFEQGKATFDFACARCHGEDGGSENYALIRKLSGIGLRLDLQQIAARMYPLPMGSSGFAVRGHIVSRDQLHALVAYVAGL